MCIEATEYNPKVSKDTIYLSQLYHRNPADSICIYIDGLVQDCSISIANTLEILRSCTKPSICIAIKIKKVFCKNCINLKNGVCEESPPKR